MIEIPTNGPEGIPYVSTVTPDQPSHGGTITFQNIGTIGWYPSSRDPLTGAGSIPYCPASSDTKYCGWDGSKMIIIQATMPRVASGVIDAVKQCGTDKTNNW